MVRYPSTVPGNLRQLHRTQTAEGVSNLGPTSVGPGEGHMRFYDANGADLLFASGDTVTIRHKGTSAPLIPLLESQADTAAQQAHDLTVLTGRVSAAESTLEGTKTRLDGVASNLNVIGSRLQTAESTLDTKASAASLSSAVTNLQTAINTKASRDTVTDVRDAANTRMDNLYKANLDRIRSIEKDVTDLASAVKTIQGTVTNLAAKVSAHYSAYPVTD